VAGSAVAGAGQVGASFDPLRSGLERRLRTADIRLVAQVEHGHGAGENQQHRQQAGQHDAHRRGPHRAFPSSPLPHSIGTGCGNRSTGLALGGMGRDASQPATAEMSSFDSFDVICAMQSGAAARRWPLRQDPNWLMM
jgi:hypothetical protein